MRNNRYAGELVFVHSLRSANSPKRKMWRERRLVNVRAPDARAALKAVRQIAKESTTTYRLSTGETMTVEFLGIRQMILLGSECEPSTVWYEVRQTTRTKADLKRAIPKTSVLAALGRSRRKR